MASRHCIPLLALFLVFTAVDQAFPFQSVEADTTTTPSIVFPVQEVVGKRIVRIHSFSLGRDDVESARFSNLSEALLEAPGVAGVRRSASQVEPVIRGLGWERVAVQINHLPVYGACPGRMDPPLSYATAGGTENVEVIKGLPSVTRGMAGTGGRVIVDRRFRRRDPAVPWKGWLRAGADAARGGFLGEAGLEAGGRRGGMKATLEALDYDDYTSGDGTTVPARQTSLGGGLATNLRNGDRSRWWTSAGLKEESDIDYPSLPMDLVSSTIFTLCTGYESRGVSPWTLEGAFYDIDHDMDNALKANRAIMEASTKSSSRGASALARYDFGWSTDSRLSVGADAVLQDRDAERTRFMTGPGVTFRDRLWPDARQDAVGLFAEYETPLGDRWRVRSGLRTDRVFSRANAADAAALGGGSVLDAWQRFYGEAAADYDRDEGLVAGNIVASSELADGWQLHLGTGLSSRAAGITERYYAFAPAPGGFMVGNPALDPEFKWELSVELEHASRRWTADVATYAHSIQDYVLTATVARQDVNGDGIVDRVRGFENAEARLYGVDASARLWLDSHWSVPVQGMYVYGQNVRDDRALAEIPAAEARIGLRYDRPGQRSWWISGTSRLVAEQDRIDSDFGEDRTAGFVTFDLRGGARLVEGLWLDVGVLNLLDKEYHEHLTREVMLPTEELAAGQEIPAPGASAYLTLKYEFGGRASASR